MEGLLSGREDDRVNVKFGPDPQSQAGDSSEHVVAFHEPSYQMALSPDPPPHSQAGDSLEHAVAVDEPCGIALSPNLPLRSQASDGDSYSRTSLMASIDGTVVRCQQSYGITMTVAERGPDIKFDRPSHDSSDDDSHDSGTVSDPDSTWVTAFENKLHLEPELLRVSSGNTLCCIHRVPKCLLESHEKKDYLPQVISIGPFHRGKKQLEAMEKHKLKYLNDFVSRNENVRLVEYMKVVKRLEKKARNCYSECFSHLNSKAFVEMMVVDGCFIIELLYKANGNGIVTKSDPIFNLPWLLRKLQNDMLLLENQIPYRVLEKLAQRNSKPGDSLACKPGDSLACLAVKFFGNMVPKINVEIMKKHRVKCKHLLHLLLLNILPETKMNEICSKTIKEEKKDEYNPSEMMHRIPKMIHCITELREAGIEFKKGKKNSFLEIEYSKGVITIPCLRIEEFTNSLLLNFIAFEQCYGKIGNHVTTYTIFMDCLINSAKDIEVLRHRDIVDNWLGNDDVVADFFNKLCREVTITSRGFYLTDVFEEVLEYYNGKCHVWRATLMRNYFSNPWAIISVLAAIILGLLTLLQTIFSGMSL